MDFAVILVYLCVVVSNFCELADLEKKRAMKD